MATTTLPQFQHVLTIGLSGVTAKTLSGKLTATGDATDGRSVDIAAGTINQAVAFNLTIAKLQSLFILSNGALTLQTNFLALPAPAAPVPTQATTGGTVAAGVYGVKVTYVNAQGETVASSAGTVTTTGTTSTITVPSPAASSPTGCSPATGWYAYVTQPGGSTYYRQQTAGSPTSIGTSLTLTAPPTTSGATAPLTDSSTGGDQLSIQNGVPIYYQTGQGMTNPFTKDITGNIYLSNTGTASVRLDIAALQNF